MRSGCGCGLWAVVTTATHVEWLEQRVDNPTLVCLGTPRQRPMRQCLRKHAGDAPLTGARANSARY